MGCRLMVIEGDLVYLSAIPIVSDSGDAAPHLTSKEDDSSSSSAIESNLNEATAEGIIPTPTASKTEGPGDVIALTSITPTSSSKTEGPGEVIALTGAHIAVLSAEQRLTLFRDGCVLPLFGKKMRYPENENGRYPRRLTIV